MKLDNIEYYTLLKSGVTGDFLSYIQENTKDIDGIVSNPRDISKALSEEDKIALSTNGIDDEPILILKDSEERKKVFYTDLSAKSVLKSKKSGKVICSALSQSGRSGSEVMFDLINRRIYQHMTKSPDFIIKNDIEKRERARRSSIERRYEEVPELSGDFEADVKALCGHARNREEFIAFIDMAGSVFNMSDRNLTRISRATICFEGESLQDEGYQGEIRVYRAMPQGMIIEEGDWITTSLDYAELHESSLVDEQSTVVDYIDASPSDIYPVNDQNEAIYAPKEAWLGAESIEDVWSIFADPKKDLNFPSIKPRTIDEIKSEDKDLSR